MKVRFELTKEDIIKGQSDNNYPRSETCPMCQALNRQFGGHWAGYSHVFWDESQNREIVTNDAIRIFVHSADTIYNEPEIKDKTIGLIPINCELEIKPRVNS